MIGAFWGRTATTGTAIETLARCTVANVTAVTLTHVNWIERGWCEWQVRIGGNTGGIGIARCTRRKTALEANRTVRTDVGTVDARQEEGREGVQLATDGGVALLRRWTRLGWRIGNSQLAHEGKAVSESGKGCVFKQVAASGVVNDIASLENDAADGSSVQIGLGDGVHLVRVGIVDGVTGGDKRAVWLEYDVLTRVEFLVGEEVGLGGRIVASVDDDRVVHL